MPFLHALAETMRTQAYDQGEEVRSIWRQISRRYSIHPQVNSLTEHV